MKTTVSGGLGGFDKVKAAIGWANPSPRWCFESVGHHITERAPARLVPGRIPLVTPVFGLEFRQRFADVTCPAGIRTGSRRRNFF